MRGTHWQCCQARERKGLVCNVPLPGRAGMAGISGSTESEMANREEQVKDSVSAVIETMATQEGAKVGRPSERASDGCIVEEDKEAS